jgi:hypothetical protein
MGEERKVYKVLVGKPEEKKLLGTPRRRWEDGVRMDLREIGLGGVDWIRLSQDRDRWLAVVSAVMNLRFLAGRCYLSAEVLIVCKTNYFRQILSETGSACIPRWINEGGGVHS